MSLLKKFLLGLLVLLAVLVVVGLFLPSSVQVERTATISAPPHVVFALVNDFSNFNRWSPWAERDAATVYTYDGPGAGVGARMSWASDHPQVGSGRQEITLSEPNRRVEALLDFGAQGTANSFFALEPVEQGTRVTWGFDTDFGLDLIGRYMGLMFDTWVGADYEKGLENLRSLAEGLPSVDWTDLEIDVLEVEPEIIALTSTESGWEAAEIEQKLAAAYGEINRYLEKLDIQQTGQPMVITTGSSEEAWQFDAAIPVAAMPEEDLDPDSEIQFRPTAGGKTVRAVSVGSYEKLRPNWEKVLAFMAVNGLEKRGAPREQYVSDPGDTPEEELITHLFIPVE